MLAKKQQHIPEQSVSGDRKESDHSLRGTFASVMILGTVLALSWVGAFLLFLART